ncbi:magnesium-translocating P-type ATPase [Rhizophagus irregularis DAOM 181602=DAOM 197198]|nr:magnesium-translocating P-type ATPase [Rhizophagus irregularis DAOM 181602=DAOM 197198]
MTSSTSKNLNDDDLTITVSDNYTQKGGLSQSLQPPIILDNIRPLSRENVTRRLESYGKNIISTYKPLTWYIVLYHSTVHPFNVILIFLAIFSGATEEDYSSLVILLIMVFLSVGIRFVQEYKSEVATQELKKMVNNNATVIRLYSPPDNRDPSYEDIEMMDRGETVEMDIPLEDIVPGDWVRLSAGDLIPGDVQLISSKDLFVSQASLTGESIPVEKFTILQQQPPIIPDYLPINTNNAKLNYSELDQPNLCFMGTSVVSELLMLFKKGGWKDAVLFAAAVAVGLTPEMLPMIVNANLARGAINLSKKKCIVKKLDSIINLGGIDILCTDKTGTLTCNKVVLINHFDHLGNVSKLPLYLGYLNSYFQTGLKNLLDVAVIEYFNSENVDGAYISQNFFKVDEIPFDFVRRRMSVILESSKDDDCRFLISKGAVDEMLTCCTNIYVGKDNVSSNEIFPTSDIIPITTEILKNMKNLNESLNNDGLRVIAVAFKDMKKCSEFTVAHESELTLVGVCAFLDPPKPSTKPALQELFKYNVEVKVLTGDSPAVCRKVCEEINLPVKSIITTTELEGIDDAKLEEIAESGTIFAKLTPLQKANIVKALKRRNHIVGFLGDGINDAPAIRESDCGISVDEGTDIAKESADIILLEKSLMVLADGIIRGRITYGNTIKYIKMAISSNFGNVFSVLIASAWLPFLPMEALQLILQNLLYDLSQIAIPWDRMDPEFLTHPKRWSARSIVKFMIFTGPWNSIFDMTTFAFMFYYYKCQDPHDVYKVRLFQTGWFVEGLITQTLIVHMIRTPKFPFLQSTASLPVCLSTLAVMSAAIIIPFTPLNKYLGMVPLPGLYYSYLLGVLVTYWFLTSFIKNFLSG